MLDYVQAVRSATENRMVLRKMSSLLDEFKASRNLLTNYLDAAIDLYRVVSPGLNRREAKRREAELAELVAAFQAEHNKGPRPSELAELLGWNHGTLRVYINSLIYKGRLIKQREKGGVRYVLRR